MAAPKKTSHCEKVSLGKPPDCAMRRMAKGDKTKAVATMRQYNLRGGATPYNKDKALPLDETAKTANKSAK